MKRLLPAVLLSCCLLSCTGKLWTEQQEAATEGLLAVYFSPALYTECSIEGASVDFGFSDGSRVNVDAGTTPVFSAADGIFPIVELKRDRWLVNGTRTGISATLERSNLQSRLVCLAYDCNAVYLYMSNGKVLHIPSTREGSLWAFNFRKADNPALPKSVECRISGTEISGTVPSGVFAGGLCPDISYRGISVSVNGKPQRNRKSRQAFGGTVEYVLTLYDESQLTYTVDIDEPYPTVRLYTEKGKPVESRDTYVGGTVRIEDPEHKYWEQDVFEAPMQIRGRGNSTWTMFPKKPYRIKLDEKAGIFGMSKNRDWALLANYSDKSLLRNTVGMMVSEICGMKWTPGIFNVDVYLNDEYLGSYDLTEHKEVASHRVDIDIAAGDCYLEIEAKKDKPVCFDTPMNIPIMFSEPEQPSDGLKTEIEGWFRSFETALTSSYSADPNRGYAAYVDVDSFINHYIIQELAKNIDADLFKSLFLVKRKGGKLEFWHVWDFDLAFGNCNYLNAHQGVTTGPTGWYVMNHTQEGINTGWYWYMFKDPGFRARVKERWIELYPRLAGVPDRIREKYSWMCGSAGRNFSRWPTLDRYVWPNQVWLGEYSAEVEYMLEFYTARLEWMNGEISRW